MLKRFKTIKNIGRFYDCEAGGIGFKKETIIYGKNGDGKSTLTTILRSLASGDDNLLIAKKTFGSSGEKRIEIVFEENSQNLSYIFQNKKWDKSYPHILIFDSKFISENIFEGEKVSDEHKANLYKNIVIGDKGKKLTEEISKLDKIINEKEGKKSKEINFYSKSDYKDYFTIDEFLQITKDSLINTKIETTEKELRFAKQLNKPNELFFKVRDFAVLRSTLEKDFKSIHEEAEKKIKEHINQNWENPHQSINFLETGLSLIKIREGKEICPFCSQDLQKVDTLIQAYQNYFDETYKEFQKEQEKNIVEYQHWNIENDLTKLASEAKDWIEFLEETSSYDALMNEIEAQKPKLISLKTQFEEECLKKQKNTKYNVNFKILDSIQEILHGIKKIVDGFNIEIKSFTSKCSVKTTTGIENDLNRLKIIKARFESQWIEFCKEYELLITEISKLKEIRDKNITELSEYSKNIFEMHQEKINSILEEIGADFKINNLTRYTDKRRAESVFCGFDLKFFDSHFIPIVDDEDKPSFKNTLSQGDKGSLAFAIFLSYLYHLDDLDKTIIIFDDPVSSFDDERKHKTIHFLTDIHNKDKKQPLQKIILTHEKDFLRKLYQEEKLASAAFLMLLPDGVINGMKKSKLVRCDVYEEFLKPKELKYLEEIKEYVHGNTSIPIDAHIKGRELMEAVFKRKYYLELKDLISDRKGLREYVVRLSEQGIYDDNKKTSFERLLNDLNVPHHNQTDRNIAENSQGDLKSILSDTLKMLKEI